uniref:Cyclin-C n=3 Tax=Schistocephalus solidus TaxID=70667 RepID=A0A0X3Q1U1_SCHSO
MACNFWRCSHYLEWLLDRQDVLRHRAGDLKILGSEEEYQKVMIFFCGVIQAFGEAVEVRQQVIATAIVYFRRFYSRTSIKSIDPWLMAPACLFLASKVEEFGVLSQKLLMTACSKVVSSQYSKYFKDYGYPYRAQDVFECEFILMEAMDCSLIVFHPYRPLVKFCEDLRPQMLGMTDCLLERAWHVVNDSMRTDLCLHYPPYLIALGCIQLAFISLEKDPPPDASDGTTDNSSFAIANRQSKLSPLAVAEHWFAELTVNMEKVLEVSRHLLALYDLWQRFNPDVEMPNILLKLPRPVIQPSQPQSQQQQQQPPSNQSAPFQSRQQSVQSQPTAQSGGGGAVSHSPNGTAMDQQLRQLNPAAGGGGGGGGHMQGRMGQPPYPFVAPMDPL